jgi:haloalkane dehalogenase
VRSGPLGKVPPGVIIDGGGVRGKNAGSGRRGPPSQAGIDQDNLDSKFGQFMDQGQTNETSADHGDVALLSAHVAGRIRGMDYVRTPDERFAHLSGFDFAPHYIELSCGLRMHYVDEGPPGGDVVLLLHGQPTWSYLYRAMIPPLVARGLRTIAPDFLGFGRSDKPTKRTDYSVRNHIAWLGELLERLDRRRMTLVVQDWGGPIGLGALVNAPDRFDRIVAANTTMHTASASLTGRLGWSCHANDEGEVIVETALLDYQQMTQEFPTFQPSLFVQGATVTDLTTEEVAAYDAPFPDETFCAGPRQLPLLMGLTPSSECARRNTKTLAALAAFEGAFLTAYAKGDPSTQGWDEVLHDAMTSAQSHDRISFNGAGHFLQEDVAPELSDTIIEFVARTRAI